MNRIFIFLEQKNSSGLYVDRGMIILYFPQDKAVAEGYQCGVGVAITLERENRDILMQRVVMIRKDLKNTGSVKKFISKYLHLSIEGKNTAMVSDLKTYQEELYSKLFPDKVRK